MKKLTKRDFLFFFLGVLTFLLIETVYHREDAKKDFLKGYHDSQNNQK
jgi:hypothetical protein